MGPGGAAAISAAGDIIGGGLGLAGSLISTKKQAKYAERMYKHRYQWQMEDMQKAGLNPMLAYQQTAGSPSVPTVPNMLEGFAESARGMAGRMSEMMSDVEKREMIDEQTKTEKLQQDVVREGVGKARAEAASASANAAAAAEQALTARDRRLWLMPAESSKLLAEAEEARSRTKSQALMRELEAARLPRARMTGEFWDRVNKAFGPADDALSAKPGELGRRLHVDELPSVLQRWMSGPPVEKKK